MNPFRRSAVPALALVALVTIASARAAEPGVKPAPLPPLPGQVAPPADAAKPPPLPSPAAAPQGVKFLRLVEDGNGGARMETAVVTYRNDAGVSVKLVAAVHIGERSYFEGLNKDFEAEDVVLYELVKEDGVPLPGPGVQRKESAPGENMIGDAQRIMKDVLKLDFQLDVVDYNKPNFVHADLDRATFEKMQQERGETIEMLMLKQLMKAFTQPPPAPEEGAAAEDPEQMLREVIRLFTRPDMERQVKLMFARQLTAIEEKGTGLELGLGDNSVIIHERNKAAMKVLAGTLADGQKKKISIFYGAAHMPDFDERLKAMGFKPVQSDWKPAWDLTIRQDQPSALEELLIEGLKALGEEGAGF